MIDRREFYSGNIRKQQETGIDSLLRDLIRILGLDSGLNTQRIFETWDSVSGAGMHTVGRYFKNGTLYCTMSSSMVRSQLLLQTDIILKKMNETLLKDELYSPVIMKDGTVRQPVEKIVLK